MIRLHELMASSSCQTTPSSALNSTPSRWDVFLSFRGTDTRYKFTSHLYDALDRHGVRTYKDDPELRSGEVISEALLEAIRESRCYIVVFSENYASSPWCLDELVEIYNCHTTFSRLVIPVFYNIDPSVVRHQIGSFKDAFEKHEIRFSGEKEKVNKWRLALTEVAKFSGKHASENRSEAIIINEIVDEILLEIDPKTLYVAKYPVGLDSHVKDITTMLSRGTEGVIRFGMYGMGGVGKTTLAKALYNRLLLGGSFKDSCFLANCREVSGTAKGLGTEVIECIIPCNIKCGYSLEGMSLNIGTFKRMGNLRFLDLTGADIIGSFEETFEDLRRLRWGKCPLTSFPSGFCLQKLVYLVLHDSNMITWELNNVLQSLKTLDMSFSKDLTTTPDFTKLPCLEALTLRGCKSLEEVHISFRYLKKLVSLDLSRCVKLRSLPDTICNLRALKVLCIHDCCSLKALPVELGKIESLKELYMNELNVSELPNSIGHLLELVELRLSNNRNLRTLPDTICSLRSLEILDISRCEKLKILPDKFWNLTRLRELDACATPLKKVPDIESSQSALSNLEELNLTGNALTTLPQGIGQLLNLRALKISCSFNLLFIAELPPNLTWIDAYGCSSLKRLPNLSNLKQLEVLELTGCSSLKEI